MKRVLIIVVVVLVLLIGGGAAAYFLAPPEMVDQVMVQAGLLEPTAEIVTPAPTEDPGINIIVARIDIDSGTFISDTQMLLDTKNIPTTQYEQQADELFREAQVPEEIQGKVLNTMVLAGDPILSTFLVEAGLSFQMPTAEPERSRPKAYPLTVSSLTGVGDRLNKGDLVDVVATFRVERRMYLPPKAIVAAPISPEDEAQQDTEALTEGEEPTATPLPMLELQGSETQEFVTTKTIVQKVKVLAILRPKPVPAPPPEEMPVDEDGNPIPPTPTPEPPPPDMAGEPGFITEGDWQVVLAVNNQQAELLEFAQKTEATLTLVLRGSGDTAYESTIGASFDLLISEFGLPLPEPEDPFVFAPEVLTPQPTRTPVSEIRIP